MVKWGVRFATWNVNGLRARMEFVLHWLRARKPDIVGFQELKMTDEQFPALEFEAEGYHSTTHGQKSWNGVAILSREKAQVTQRGLPGQEELGSRLITADIGGLSFTTIYLPNGKTVEHPDYPRKLAWLEALTGHVNAARPAILCGDFNICPEAIDSWNEDPALIFHTEAERSRFQALLDRGLADIFRQRFPDEQKFSWWDYRGGAFHRKQGLRIDLILGTADVAERVRSIEIDREYRKKQEGLTASDHAPVIVDLDD